MNKLIYFYSFLLLIIISIWFVILSIPDNQLKIIACDVGQGDGFIITQGTFQMIVDGGPNNNISTCVSKHIPFWDRKVEVVMVTNPDRDHYFGFIELLGKYQVENFVSPGVSKQDANYQKLLAQVDKYKIKNTSLKAGNVLIYKDIRIDIVWPSPEYFETTTEVNALSLVFNLRYKNFKALFTGDIEPPGVEAMLLTGVIGDVDVLKVPHHGSKNGLTQTLFEMSRPETALISSGIDNQWGHPEQETLDILGNIKVYRTDQVGEFEIVSDGSVYKVNP